MNWTEAFDYSLLDEEALQYLLDHNHVEGAAAGITKKVIADRGFGGLTPKQLEIFKTHVVDAWLLRKCKCGDHPVEGHELIGLWVNDGYCSRCAERMERDD
jgi:hypothetical protein